SMPRNSSHRRFLVAAVLGCVLSFGPARAAPNPSTAGLGSRVDPLPIRDAQGQEVRLPESAATGVVVLSFDCPVANSSAEPLAGLAKEFGPEGVTFIALCPTDAPAAEVAKQAKEFPLGFPVFKDEQLAAADALKAEAVPEAFVLDRHHVLRYRGRI